MIEAAVAGTPVGPFTVLARDRTVIAAGFTEDVDRLLGYLDPTPSPEEIRQVPSLGSISDAVAAYLAGDVFAIDAVPVANLAGDGFRARAWRAMRTIPPGRPASYGWLATAAGADGWEAARAAGQACARNPSSLFVP